MHKSVPTPRAAFALPVLLFACCSAPQYEEPPPLDSEARRGHAQFVDTDGARTWVELAGAQRTDGPIALKLADAGDSVVVRVEGRNLAAPYHLYIDADGDWKTGIQSGAWEATGVDYLIENGFLYKTLHPWLDTSEKWEVQPVQKGDAWEFEIPKELLEGLEPDLNIGLGYVELSGGQIKTQLPATRDFGRPKRAWTRGGVIVPAYLRPDQEDAWERLVLAAKEKPSETSARTDFWVVINGNDNGPYTTYSEYCGTCEDQTQKQLEAAKVVPDAYLDDAKSRWTEVAEAHAKLIGYVHTCRQKEDCGGLRPINEVKAAVDKWLRHVPNLGGIWIDEFYPQYDDSSREQGGQFVPEAGYYGELVKYIRDKGTERGESLVIVGNAGGRLISNRMDYAGLVDVLCSFESAYEELEPKRAVGDAAAWPGIARQPLRPIYGQLALVHNVREDDQAGVVARALAEGYSHVFVTDGNYDRETLWRDIPAYLSEQRSLVAAGGKASK